MLCIELFSFVFHALGLALGFGTIAVERSPQRIGDNGEITGEIETIEPNNYSMGNALDRGVSNRFR